MQPHRGAVHITGQTLVLCVNGLCFRPAISAAALCLYIALGISHTAALSALGPQLNVKTVGYVFGFLPATALLGAARQTLGPWHLAMAPALGFSVLAQGVVLACGATWLRRSYDAPLSATVRPYLPGLLGKSIISASIVSALGRLDTNAFCLPAQAAPRTGSAPCSTPSDPWLSTII